MNRTSFFLIASLALIGIIARLIDHVPNFAPITALALVSAYYLPRRISWLVPLAAIFVSDAIIGFYAWPVMVSVYGSFALAWLFGAMAASSGSRSSLIPATLAASVVFFLVTNASVWAFTDMYAKNAGGLLQSYVMAIPFFKSSFASDVLFTAGFVSLVEIAFLTAPRRSSADAAQVS